jgi:prophage antirepressor-like protein
VDSNNKRDMSKKELLKLFDNKNIRVVWDDELQEWFFSVVDVVGALTDSKNPTDYLKKMRKREVELDVYLGTNCPQVLMTTPSGKRRKTLAGNPLGVSAWAFCCNIT